MNDDDETFVETYQDSAEIELDLDPAVKFLLWCLRLTNHENRTLH